MKLLVISHTPHYWLGEQVVGWGPTVRELDHLSSLFDRTVHLAPLHEGPAPANALPYQSSKLSLCLVRPSGGPRFVEKLGILGAYPSYVAKILTELRDTDVVHIRCPANISLLAVMLLSFRSRPKRRWIKYATNWQPHFGEAWSSKLQRWILKSGWANGRVTVNGDYPDQPEYVVPFLNPCLTAEELEMAQQLLKAKPDFAPLRLLFVGTLDENKGVLRALEIFLRVRKQGINVHFEVVGDGPQHHLLEKAVQAHGASSFVTIHGWLPRTALCEIYARSHLLLLTSRSEGWPKVISEAMAYGVVPIASSISCIPDYLSLFKVGRSFQPEDLEGFVGSIIHYFEHQEAWRTESVQAVQVAAQFGYSSYLQKVCRLLELDQHSSGGN